MDLNKKQDELFAGIRELTDTEIAQLVALGLNNEMAMISQKVETASTLLVPAMTGTGEVSGDIIEMYEGRGEISEGIEQHLANCFQSVSMIASSLNIPLVRIAEKAFEENPYMKTLNPGGVYASDTVAVGTPGTVDCSPSGGFPPAHSGEAMAEYDE